jgi:hypothetical protein
VDRASVSGKFTRVAAEKNQSGFRHRTIQDTRCLQTIHDRHDKIEHQAACRGSIFSLVPEREGTRSRRSLHQLHLCRSPSLLVPEAVIYRCDVGAMSARCEIVELRNPTDTVGYACTRDASAHCDDCGSGLCGEHWFKCHLCRQTFCAGCLSFHQDSAPPKPATRVGSGILEKRSA